MATIEDVSGTAFVVAEYRAEENRDPAPIYRDPVVGVFLSDRTLRERRPHRPASLERLPFRRADVLHLGRHVMYMPLATDAETMRLLKQHVMEFRLSFDYLTEAVVTKTTGDASLTTLVESFEAMRAPWLSGIDDVHGLAGEIGLRVVEDVTTGELFRKYRGRAAASPIFHHYSVCTLES